MVAKQDLSSNTEHAVQPPSTALHDHARISLLRFVLSDQHSCGGSQGDAKRESGPGCDWEPAGYCSWQPGPGRHERRRALQDSLEGVERGSDKPRRSGTTWRAHALLGTEPWVTTRRRSAPLRANGASWPRRRDGASGADAPGRGRESRPSRDSETGGDQAAEAAGKPRGAGPCNGADTRSDRLRREAGSVAAKRRRPDSEASAAGGRRRAWRAWLSAVSDSGGLRDSPARGAAPEGVARNSRPLAFSLIYVGDGFM